MPNLKAASPLLADQRTSSQRLTSFQIVIWPIASLVFVGWRAHRLILLVIDKLKYPVLWTNPITLTSQCFPSLSMGMSLHSGSKSCLLQVQYLIPRVIWVPYWLTDWKCQGCTIRCFIFGTIKIVRILLIRSKQICNLFINGVARSSWIIVQSFGSGASLSILSSNPLLDPTDFDITHKGNCLIMVLHYLYWIIRQTDQTGTLNFISLFHPWTLRFHLFNNLNRWRWLLWGRSWPFGSNFGLIQGKCVSILLSFWC